MVSDLGSGSIPEGVLSYLIDAEVRLALAYQLGERAQECESPTQLFTELRDEVKRDGGFEHLLYFRYTDAGLLSIDEVDAADGRTVPARIPMVDTHEIDDRLSEHLQCAKDRILKEYIGYEGEDYALLVGVALHAPKPLTYNARGILRLFASFIELKAVEQRYRKVQAFRRVIAEKSVVIGELLVLQELWIRRTDELVGQLHTFLVSRSNESLSEPIRCKTDEIRVLSQKLRNLSRVTIDAVGRFTYFDERIAVRDPCPLATLLQHSGIAHDPKMNGVIGEVLVDLEQVCEAFRQLRFVSRQLDGQSAKPLEFMNAESSDAHCIISFACALSDPERLTYLERNERHWNSVEGVLVSGPALLSYSLAKRLIAKSGGKLTVFVKNRDASSGFQVILPAVTANE